MAPTFGAETAFVEPEILKIDPATIDTFIAAGAAAEGLHALPARHPPPARSHADRSGGAASSRAPRSWPSAASNVYGIFSDADFPYPTVTLSDGKSVKLDSAGFSLVPRRSRTAAIARRSCRRSSARSAASAAPSAPR